MNGYELSPEAQNDLQEIWIHIAQDNPAAADKLEEDIYEACELLAKNPHLGHKRPDSATQCRPVPQLAVCEPGRFDKDRHIGRGAQSG